MIAPEPYEYALFGTKRCSLCGMPLPANSDFFGREKLAPSGLKPECRSCLSEVSKASYARCREKRLVNARDRRQRLKAAAS